MYYKFDRESNTGYLYGSPVTDGDIEIEIIALNSHTYDTTMDTLKLTVVERESKSFSLALQIDFFKVHSLPLSRDQMAIRDDILARKETFDIFL